MGARKNSKDTPENKDEVKIVAAPEVSVSADAEVTVAATPKKGRVRSLKYHSVRSKIDRTKTYTPHEAIELIKKLSYSSFDGTITAHVVVREAGTTTSITFPHSTGQTVRVAIASDALLEKIAAGTLEFDILVTSPEYMPKLAKFAPILGPKGLMPNPKNGTITKDPETVKKRLEGGMLTLKTEKKAPLMHVTLGKVSMDETKLSANLATLIKALTGKVLKITLASSMSPGVKVTIEK